MTVNFLAAHQPVLEALPSDLPGDASRAQACLARVLDSAAADLADCKPGGEDPKRLVELTDLLYWAAQASPRLRSQVDGMAEEIAARVWTSATLRLLMRSPQRALAEAGSVHLYLRLLGLSHPVIDELVHRAATWPPVEHVERLPSKRLRVLWLLDRSDGGARVCQADALFGSSILNARSHPVFATLRDSYLFTHAIWYASDYGERPLVGPMKVEAARAWVEGGLAWCAYSGHFDLGLEYLMDALTLHDNPPAATVFWRHFAAEAARLHFLPGNLREDGTHASGYHHRYLLGKVCALTLLHPWVGGNPARPRWAEPEDVAMWRRALDATPDEPGTASSCHRPAAHAEESDCALEGALIDAARRGDVVTLLAGVQRWFAEAREPVPTLAAVLNYLCRHQLPNGELPPCRRGDVVIERHAATAAFAALLRTALDLMGHSCSSR